MSFSDAKRKLHRNYHDYGFLETVKKSIMYLTRGFFYIKTYRIYRKNLLELSTPVQCSEGLNFAIVGDADRERIAQIETMEEWLEGKVCDILRNNGFCLAVIDDTRVAGFNLVSLEDFCLPLIRVQRKLRPFEAWSEQISVGKAYRGRGLATLLRKRMFHELHDRGIRKLYGGTQSSNKANLALCRKVGLQEIADIRYLRILGFERWYVTKVRRAS